jgi:hypothetical protein
LNFSQESSVRFLSDTPVSDHDALPTIAASQRTPLVEQLLEQIEQLLEANRRRAELIQQLRDEIAILKG